MPVAVSANVGKRSARRPAARPRAAAETILRTDPAPRCAVCAAEVTAAVRSRGSLFCSIECALTATIPGLYLG